jgi:hypothetical protein
MKKGIGLVLLSAMPLLPARAEANPITTLEVGAPQQAGADEFTITPPGRRSGDCHV